jgi:hypothetical protein
MSVTDIIMSDVTDKNYGKSGGKKLLTSCFLTPLVHVRDGHNYVGCDGQKLWKIGRKKIADILLFNPTSTRSKYTYY